MRPCSTTWLADTYPGGTTETTLNLLVSSVHPHDAGVQVPLVHALLDYGAAGMGRLDLVQAYQVQRGVNAKARNNWGKPIGVG